MRALRIVLVEDDAMISALLAETLESNGHCVCSIEATEAGAVRAAARHRPDLMIVDVSLRVGSGLAAMEQILRMGPVPHVFMSGDGLSPDVVSLLKPFRETALLQAIERAVASAGAA